MMNQLLVIRGNYKKTVIFITVKKILFAKQNKFEKHKVLKK